MTGLNYFKMVLPLVAFGDSVDDAAARLLDGLDGSGTDFDVVVASSSSRN